MSKIKIVNKLIETGVIAGGRGAHGVDVLLQHAAVKVEKAAMYITASFESISSVGGLTIVDRIITCCTKVVQLLFPFHFGHQIWIQIENGQLPAILFFRNHVFTHYSLTFVDRIITCRTKFVQFLFCFYFVRSDLDSNRKWPTGSHFVFQKSCFQPILINYCR